MSKISDELRRWCDKIDHKREGFWNLRELADRIDAETVELPRDRDGVPIHVGDTVYLEDGQKAEVISIVLAECASVINCWTYGKSLAYMSSGISHKPADSWERIADELKHYANDSCSEDEIDGMTASTLVDFADRIRKLAEKEGE